MTEPVIVWFREDLRLGDNPALHAAVASKRPILPVFIHDDGAKGPRPRGGAALWWLHGSLESLGKNIAAKGGRLHLFAGDAGDILPELAQATKAKTVVWNRRYDDGGRRQDAAIETALVSADVAVESFNGRLLGEPDALKTKSGGYFRVYTPFWNALHARGDPPAPLRAPSRLNDATLPQAAPKPVNLQDLALLPTGPDWAGGLRDSWTPGEAAARKRLRTFLDHKLDCYASERDFPAVDSSSRLSPYLAAGELSARQVWHAVRHAEAAGTASRENAGKLLKELAWREFSYHLLFHNRYLATANFNPKFDAFPWAARPAAHVRAWQAGLTGYPIVDAGMRQLWQIGWMHNRVRLITGSFLVKHLLVDWRTGENWFWDTLCDADAANNAQNWQWVAGSGADAAPYFRIFNPVLQGERFDPEGEYVKHFVPELRKMPARLIHRPWEAASDVLDTAGVVLGRDYPRPVVDHGTARAAALAAFGKVKG